MEYLEESQILLDEEICGRSYEENSITRATVRFRENIRLAHSIAAKFAEPIDPAIGREDIFQEAYLGLWIACLNFDEDKGYQFSTYAYPVIKGHVLRSLRESEALKTPRYFKDMRSALKEHGFTVPLSDEEIDILVTEGKFSRAQILDYAEPNLINFDSPIKGDSETTYNEVIPSDFKVSYEFDEDEIETIVDKIVSYIKPKYRDMVEEWIYSVLAGMKITQNGLGRKYNLSQAQIARVLANAVSIMKMHGEEIRDLFGI